MNAKTTQIREMNKEHLRNIMKETEVFTKNSLAYESGLSVATCGNLIKAMLLSGEIIEIEQSRSNGGRPSRQFVYNKAYQHVLALYLRIEDHQKYISIGVANLLGEIVYSQKEEENQIDIHLLEKYIEKVIEKYPTISGISIGVPAVVTDGSMSGISDFEELKEVKVCEALREVFDLPVILENDVNLAAFGYYQRHNYVKEETLAYIYYPVNGCPGAGLMIHGQLYTGYTAFAGEVGFLPLNHSASSLEEKISGAIINLVCSINPKTVVLAGLHINEGTLERVYVNLNKWLPSKHLPEIILCNDLHEDYLHGLTEVALNLLGCHIKIVER